MAATIGTLIIMGMFLFLLVFGGYGDREEAELKKANKAKRAAA